MSKGFTLIEVAIVVVLIGILGSIAYPQYTKYIYKTQRVEALTQLHKVRARYELYLLETGQYPTSNHFPPQTSIPATKHYTYSSIVSGTNYTITASAIGSQANDEEDGQTCSTLVLSQTGYGLPTACWLNQ